MVKKNNFLILLLLCIATQSNTMSSWFSWLTSKKSYTPEYEQLITHGAALHALMKKHNKENSHTTLPTIDTRLAYLVYKKHSDMAIANEFVVDACGVNNLIFDIAYQSNSHLYADFNDNLESPRGVHVKNPNSLESVAHINADRVTNPGLAFSKNNRFLAFKQNPVSPEQSWKTKTVDIYQTNNYQQQQTIDSFNNIFEFAWSPQEENLMVINTIQNNNGTCHFVRLEDKSHKTIGSLAGYHPQWNPAYALMATTNRSQYTEEITIYDLNAQQQGISWGYDNSELLETHWNSTGKLLSVGGRFKDDNKRIIDIRNQDGKSICTLPMPDGPYTHIDDWHNELLLAHVWGSDTACVWDTRNTKTPACTIILEQSPIIDGKINHKNNDIVLIPRQGDIFVYAIDGSKKMVIKWPGQNIKLALSDDGNFLSCIRLQPNLLYGGSSTPVVLTIGLDDGDCPKPIVYAK